MSISRCIVRVKDCHNTEHSVEVYAESLYEAVLRGLTRFQDVGWESNGNETIQRVEVEIHQEPTRHIVDVPKLLKWVEEKSMYPAQETRKAKLWKFADTYLSVKGPCNWQSQDFSSSARVFRSK
jgi:hypothetical protein